MERSLRVVVGSLGLAALVGACKDEPSISGPEGPTYFRDVKPIVDAKCVVCHVAGGIAPYPMTSYDEVAGLAEAIGVVVNERTMPPWLPAPDVRPLLHDPTLTEDELATIEGWIEAQVPEGDPQDEGPPLVVDHGGLSRVDLEISMPEAYTPTILPDDYRCFPVEWPLTDTVFVTGTRGVPGSPSVVHHHAYYVIPAASRPTIEGFDAQSEEPGYPCYGGPSLTDSDALVVASSIGAWTPGNDGTDFPAGTGLRVEPGGLLVIQVHYNTLAAGAQPDLSKVEFSYESQVESEAFYAPWLDVEWPSTFEAMLIPAGEAGVHHSFQSTFDAAPLVSLFKPAALDTSNGVLIHSSLQHMHQLGTTIELSVVRGGSQDEPILKMPRWDYHWQREHSFVEPVEVAPDDEIRVDCWFDNTPEQLAHAGRQDTTPVDVGFGEDTTDEMCVAFMYITAR